MTGRDTPSASIIIPAYNATRWLRRTLDSARSQTLSDIEIIVVDDGSTDDTAGIVDAAAKDDPRIILIRQANGGVARARNAGIAHVRSPFVAPLDADDLWHPTRLEKHVAALRAAPTDVGVAYSLFRMIDEDDRVIRLGPGIIQRGEVFEPLLIENFVGNGSGITVRTELLKRVGGYSAALRDSKAQGAEDWLIQLKLAYVSRYVFVPGYLIGYRVNVDNMSSDFLQMKHSIVLNFKELRQFTSDVPASTYLWPEARAKGRLAHQFARNGRWPEAVKAATDGGMNPLLPPYLVAYLLLRGFRKLTDVIAAAATARRASRQRPLYTEADPDRGHSRAPLSSTLLMPLYRVLGRQRLTRGHALSKQQSVQPPTRSGR